MMRRYRSSGLVICVSVALISLAQADQPTSAPACGAGPTATTQRTSAQQTTVQMNFTDQQKAKIKAILEKAHEDAKATTDRNAKRLIFKAANDNIQYKVMTDAQRAKLTETRAKHDRRRKAASQPASQPTSQPAPK